jgi:DNA polymerase V
MIALADCNNFYASCERVFNSKLKNKPIIVLSNNGGCIIARSNEAKALGLLMGEPVFKKKAIIDKYKVHVFSSNFALYGDMSNRVMSILIQEGLQTEIYSIDEAFLNFSGINDYALRASTIVKKIKKCTGLPISIGVSKTKTLAKIANHLAKNDTSNGVFCLTEPDLINKSLKKFPIEKVWGIGKQYTIFLKKHNINTAYQFMRLNSDWVKQNMTIIGSKIHRELNGETCFDISNQKSAKKSICTSRSFNKDIDNFNDLKEAVMTYAARCSEKLRLQKSVASFISVFIQTNPFKDQYNQYQGYHGIKLDRASNDIFDISNVAYSVLKLIYKKEFNYKKSGIILSGIVPENSVQLSIFYKENNTFMRNELMKSIDGINKKMGKDTVYLLGQGIRKKCTFKKQKNSSNYTTRWSELLKVKA